MSNEESTEKERKRDPIYLVVIILLLIVIGTLGWKLYNKSVTIKKVRVEKEEMSNEKREVKSELDSMLNEYNSMEVENDSMRARIEKEKKKIKELRDKIGRYQYSLSKAKDEAETLRNIMQGYVEDIDSLQQANKRLTQENQKIQEELGETQESKDSLAEKTEKMEKNLEKASVLNTANLEATGIRHNLLGNPKETDRAGRTEKFRVSFTLNENEFAEKGPRELYLRIINPSGQVFSKGKDDKARKFEFEGVRGQFTLKHRIEYKKQEMDITLYYDLQDQEIEEGEYVVKVYESEEEIGSKSFVLE
jgi:regulator of replication initiation timing